MKHTGQVNGLYPIIRRVRRPLLPTDGPADAKPATIEPKVVTGESQVQVGAKENDCGNETDIK